MIVLNGVLWKDSLTTCRWSYKDGSFNVDMYDFDLPICCTTDFGA